MRKLDDCRSLQSFLLRKSFQPLQSRISWIVQSFLIFADCTRLHNSAIDWDCKSRFAIDWDCKFHFFDLLGLHIFICNLLWLHIFICNLLGLWFPIQSGLQSCNPNRLQPQWIASNPCMNFYRRIPVESQEQEISVWPKIRNNNFWAQ